MGKFGRAKKRILSKAELQRRLAISIIAGGPSNPPRSSGDFLLMETSGYILQEDGTKIKTETSP